MSVQDALQVAGIISCVMAGLLMLLTVHSFVSQNIPSVLDDLSGRKRARELGRTAAAGTHGAALVMRPMPAVDVQPLEREGDIATEVATCVQDSRRADSDSADYELLVDVVLCGTTADVLGAGVCHA